ncbi:MAG: MoxR family ATPase, partial [Thermoprotei archaeon]
RDWDELDKVNTILSDELKTPYKYHRELIEIRNNVKEVRNYVSSLQGVESKYVESRFRIILRDLEITKDRVLALLKECSDERVQRLGDETLTLIDETIEILKRRLF